MELSYTINGNFDLAKCQHDLETEFEEHFLYMNCLYKKKDNIREITLYFSERLETKKILRIMDIVKTYGDMEEI